MKTILSAVSTRKAALQTASCYAVHIAAATPVRICSWDVNITLDGETFTGGVPIKKPRISASYAAGGSVSLGNVDGSFTSLVINNSLKKKNIAIYEVFFDDNNTVVGAETLFSGTVGGQKLNELLWCDIILSPFSVGSEVQTPRRRIVPSCEFVFKGNDCGYSGAETYCAKTYEGCRNGGFPFGGFRFIPVPGKVFAWGNTIITVE